MKGRTSFSISISISFSTCLVGLLLLGSVRPGRSCPNDINCPDDETCCQTKTGLWACCPFEEGICCDDGLHCCPKGSSCSSNGTCLPTTDEQPTKFNQVQCQDGTLCPDGNTCCPLASGEFACCPIENAVCCSDHVHCCPQDHECDLKRGRCRRKLASLTQLQCPDGSSCPDGDTCCLLQSGDYGCCPLCDAVCCSDQLHCCPHGSTCDVEKGQCLTDDLYTPWLEKRPSTRRQEENLTRVERVRSKLVDEKPIKLKGSSVTRPDEAHSFMTILCPDGISTCLEDETCCQLADGSYGCCPYRQATCCPDQIHCCPDGYSCDKAGQRCTRRLPDRKERKGPKSTSKLSPFVVLTRAKDDQLCPDGRTRCPLTSTCCPNENEQSYSCCPYSKGVCCGKNGSLCCPNKYTCDPVALSCQLQDDLRTRRTLLSSVDDYRQCGTSDVACSYEQTCCRTYGSSDAQYACCAFSNGKCCEDGRHCCPSDSVCDVQSGGCIQVY